MNYIARLKAEREAAERELRALRLGLNHLRAYLVSDKFAMPRGTDQLTGYVNVKDVFLRLSEAEAMAGDARDGIVMEDAQPVEPVAQPEPSLSHLMMRTRPQDEPTHVKWVPGMPYTS